MILFSDGVPEATHPNGEFFGDERIEQVVREFVDAAAPDLVRGIVGRVTEFESGALRNDDIACVSVVYQGPIIE